MMMIKAEAEGRREFEVLSQVARQIPRWSAAEHVTGAKDRRTSPRPLICWSVSSDGEDEDEDE